MTELGTSAMQPAEDSGIIQPAPPPIASYVDRDCRRFVPLPLYSVGEHGVERVAAVLVIHQEQEHAYYDRLLLSSMAAELLEHGDVTGITVEQASTESIDG